MRYPIDIQNFQETIYNIVGISFVESGICDLSDVDSQLLLTVEYAHLPIAALLRTEGGRPNELLVQFRFIIDKSTEGLEALEFIAWFVRDCARGGKKIQLTPFALPAETPYGKQLGSTLRFHIDLFCDEMSENLNPVYEIIRQLNQSLTLAIKLYNTKIKGNILNLGQE
ncbi:hypothetical protein [Pelosinus sp. IPA-1]|uniref:hypothetical protein n=1 Tax=Pelosinus sp. IPA-1 TaxID=3029569 RepID=UPI0024362612|nr:hypothetical protein [Pelosinus sp. IPA-1]GMA99476.1 hypothetical protein PIPA1_22760 [Pelosinus sp. IPA-1]